MTYSSIGIVGYGNMGSAIAQRLKSSYDVWVFDKDKDKTASLSGINLAVSLKELVGKADTIILAVKPQDFKAVLGEVKNYINRKLIISIAAGITTECIEKTLGEISVIRAMPNIGVKIGESVTCFSRGAFATREDVLFARRLFERLGVTMEIREKMMNSATAISGSGPAYIYEDMEASLVNSLNMTDEKKETYIKRMREAAKEVGFNSEEEAFLAVNTVNASLRLAKDFMLLKRQICSKGGTTEAALKVLRQTGSWKEAAKAALRRAEELSQKGY